MLPAPVLAHRHARKDVPALRCVSDSGSNDLAGSQTIDLASVEPDTAGGRAHQPADRAQRGRFSGPVGTDQGHDLALADRQRDPVQCRDPSVAGNQILDLEQHA